jgi:hypothetical protein
VTPADKTASALSEVRDRFALAHRSIVNANGLFRRLGCDADYAAILDVTWESVEGVYVRFWGPNLLGVKEALVLMALLSLAGELHRNKLRTVHTEAKAKQPDPLSWLNSALATTVDVSTSLRKLAVAAGLGTGGDSLEAAWRCLERLGAVSVWTGRERLAKRTTMQNHQLIKVRRTDNGAICVTLAPLLVDAMLGSNRHNTYVLLSSILELPASGYSRLLALRLSWINPGEQGEIGLDKLARYLWPDRPASAVERTRLRAAMEALDDGQWTVTKKPGTRTEVYCVRRPIDAGLARANKRRATSETVQQVGVR